VYVAEEVMENGKEKKERGVRKLIGGYKALLFPLQHNCYLRV